MWEMTLDQVWSASLPLVRRISHHDYAQELFGGQNKQHNAAYWTSPSSTSYRCEIKLYIVESISHLGHRLAASSDRPVPEFVINAS
jgi:hypothetical protein